MMQRISDAWFEFKGKNSRDMGIALLSMPTRSLPGRNYTRKKVSGRNGSVVLGDGAYDDVNVKLEFDVIDPAKTAEVNAWLSGSGLLRFSDEPAYAYEASIEKTFNRSSATPRLATQRYQVTWVCHPFRRHYPEQTAIVFNASGGELVNPGTAEAEPLIMIVGSGDFSLTIGMDTMFFNDVQDGIIVDSELMDAFTIDGGALANDHVGGQFFRVAPGKNYVLWEAESSTGSSVTSVTITPRWRSL